MPKLSCAQLRDHLILRHNHLSSGSSFVLTVLCMLMIRIRRYLFACFTWKTLSNHVFEDLRKPKAPNNSCSTYKSFSTISVDKSTTSSSLLSKVILVASNNAIRWDIASPRITCRRYRAFMHRTVK
jgi:hypothetical protein